MLPVRIAGCAAVASTNSSPHLNSLLTTPAQCALFQYDHGEELVLWMNTVGPYHNRQETYSFFTLPFCKGPKKAISHHHETLGENLQVCFQSTTSEIVFFFFFFFFFFFLREGAWMALPLLLPLLFFPLTFPLVLLLLQGVSLQFSGLDMKFGSTFIFVMVVVLSARAHMSVCMCSSPSSFSSFPPSPPPSASSFAHPLSFCFCFFFQQSTCQRQSFAALS